MDLTVGSIYEGKVTGITGFGAFVQLEPGKSGMVHISEVANTYVDDIKKHINEGDIVKVKLIGIDQNGRINLSIKKALPVLEKPQTVPKYEKTTSSQSSSTDDRSMLDKSQDSIFEDKLRMFMQRSESKISDLRLQKDKKSKTRRRK
ncbi:MAG: S1 RNA-binding domain-containing protein [Clostridiaceae bacterium]|nr:S1 RNA-binding domain-containing protein [Clostridiaceae bacterium]